MSNVRELLTKAYYQNELLHILSNAAVGDESEVREVVVKRGEFQRNPILID